MDFEYAISKTLKNKSFRKIKTKKLVFFCKNFIQKKKNPAFNLFKI